MEDQGVWEVMEPKEGTSTLSAADAAKATAKDKKVRAHLLQCLPDDLLMQVAKKKTGKEVWDSLKAHFVGADRVKDAWLQTLKSEFDAIRMKDDESLDQIVGKLTAMSVKYNSLGGAWMMLCWGRNCFISCPIDTSMPWPVSNYFMT